jgi:hypothetical protein
LPVAGWWIADVHQVFVEHLAVHGTDGWHQRRRRTEGHEDPWQQVGWVTARQEGANRYHFLLTPAAGSR